MGITPVLVGICLLALLLFLATHLRPLTTEEVRALATKRRNRRIREYFALDGREFDPNREVNVRIYLKGSFCPLDEPLHEFPALAASLLKYKRHEWTIIAFERDKRIFLAWSNKGQDDDSVYSRLPDEEIAAVADRTGTTSVLCFHNHPNPDPIHWDYTHMNILVTLS